jgi:ankyrin repeat protein
MLQHPSADRLHLDYYPGDSECTVREIIVEIYPELQTLLPAPLIESLDSSDREKNLLAAFQHGRDDIFKKNLVSGNPNPWYDEPYHSSLLEIACQMKNRKEFVELLLDKGADPNIKNCVTDMPLIHATARSGNFEVLQVLLQKEGIDTSLNDRKERTILHWLAQVREMKPNDKYILENCFKLVLNILSIKKVGVDFRDVSENTALYIALEKKFRDRAKLLLSAGANVGVLGNACTVLLPTTLPIMEEVIEDCLETNDELIASKDIEIRLNYQLLMNIVPPIAESRHLRNLLKHPVISTFLNLKWQHFQFVVVLNLAFYLSFLIVLTAYILTDRGVASNTTDHFSFNDSHMNDSNFISQREGSCVDFLRYFLLILLIILVGRELFQLIKDPRAYVLSLENWLEVSLIVVSCILVSSVVDGMEIKLHLSAIALFLGWFEMLLMSGRLPKLSLKLEMFKTVSSTFLSFIAGYVTLLVAFALSFYILFRRNPNPKDAESFSSPFFSLLKTIVMFTGEFEASSLSFDILPYTSHVIFLLFVFMVAIILLNLLNGLAVSDTDEIRNTAETLSLVARSRLMSKIEEWTRFLPTWMILSELRIKELCILYPNRPNSIGSTQLRPLLTIISKKRQANMKRESSVGEDKWSIFTEKMELQQNELERKLDEVQKILKQILTRLDTTEC